MTTPGAGGDGEDDPQLTPDEIEATRNKLLPVQPKVLPGISEVSQDPDLFPLGFEVDLPEPGVAPIMAATVPYGTATALIYSARKNLGLGESPPGSNKNRVVTWYNLHIAAIGAGSWCDMGVTEEAHDSGNAVAVCGGKDKGFAYCPSHAAWFVSIGRWKYGGGDLAPGDIVFYQWNGHRTTVADHVGIVEKVFADGTFYAIECNTDDVCARRHRDTTYVAGRGRPAFSAQQEDDMPNYVSLSLKAPQKFTAKKIEHMIFTQEDSDAQDAHADGPYPGIVSGGKKGAIISCEVNIVGAAGTYTLREVDPKNKYATHKTNYAVIPIGTPHTFNGLVDAGMHLYLMVTTEADGDVNVKYLKCPYWPR